MRWRGLRLSLARFDDGEAVLGDVGEFYDVVAGDSCVECVLNVVCPVGGERFSPVQNSQEGACCCAVAVGVEAGLDSAADGFGVVSFSPEQPNGDYHGV